MSDSQDVTAVRDSYNTKFMIMTLGGSPNPIKISLEEHRPEYLLFVVSDESSESVQPILRELKWHGPRDMGSIRLSNIQDLLPCVLEIRDGVIKFMEKKKFPIMEPVLADITGGTKPMAAALTLAMMDFNSTFCYVGGTKRSKNEVGIVLDGYEEILALANPWKEMGLRSLRQLVYAFNHCQYQAAMNEADSLLKQTEKNKKFYIGLHAIIEGFKQWDAFDHTSAMSSFKKGIANLQTYADCLKTFNRAFAQFQNSQKRLEQVYKDSAQLLSGTVPLPAEYGGAYLRDLMANVLRRASQGHYDDAVARLYSVVEKIAKIQLAHLGINNSNIQPEQLEGTSVACLAEKRESPEDKIQIPLHLSWQLLGEKQPDNPYYQTFEQIRDELADALTARNNSLLAHGYSAIGEEHYRKLLLPTLKLLNLKEKDLPAFPTLDINTLLV